MCELLEKDKEITELKSTIATQVKKYNQLKEQYDSLELRFTNYIDKVLIDRYIDAIREKDNGSFAIMRNVKHSDSFEDKLRKEIVEQITDKDVKINLVVNTYAVTWSKKANHEEDEYNRTYTVSWPAKLNQN